MSLEQAKTSAPEWPGPLVQSRDHPEILQQITDIRQRLEAQRPASVEARLDDSGQFVLLKVPGVEDFECRLAIRPDRRFDRTIEGPLPRIINIPQRFGDIITKKHESHLPTSRMRYISDPGYGFYENLDYIKEGLAKPLLMDSPELQEIVLVEGERQTHFVRTGDRHTTMWVEQGVFPLRPEALIEDDRKIRRFASSEGVDYLQTKDAGIVKLIPAEGVPINSQTHGNVYFVEPYPLKNGVLLQHVPTNLETYGPRGDAPSSMNEYQFYYDNGLTTFHLIHGLAESFPPNLYVENTSEGKHIVFDGVSLPLPPEGTVLVSAFTDMRYRVTRDDLVLEEGSMLVFKEQFGSFRGESWHIYLPGLKRRLAGFVLSGPHRSPDAGEWDEWNQVYLSWEGNHYPNEVARVIATHPAFKTIKIVDVVNGRSRGEKIFERKVEGNPEEATHEKVRWEMVSHEWQG